MVLAADANSRIVYMGCPIDSMTIDQAVARCLRWCREPREPHILVTLNAATLVMMRRDAELREACLAGDVFVPDGMPVLWAARLAGNRLASRVAGVDLFAHLLAAGSDAGLRVFFLGARQQVLDDLLAVCQSRYPGLSIAGYRNGYFGPQEHGRIIEQISRSGADMLFVGMPTPFKELWLAAHKEELGVPVMIGVGGSFDVVAGHVKRAPGWMQRIGMEWFWRLLMEPRKMWKRYLVCNSAFIWQASKEILRNRLLGRTAVQTITCGGGAASGDGNEPPKCEVADECLRKV